MRQSVLQELLLTREQLVVAKEGADRALRSLDSAISNVYHLSDQVRDGMLPGVQSITRPEVREALIGAPDAEAFDRCPVCGSTAMVRLAPDRIDRSAVPIVGCGNPWHYFSPRPELKPLTAAELPSYELHPREAAR